VLPAPALVPTVGGFERAHLVRHGIKEGMATVAMSGRLDELDGLNPTRALILQAYYALRRCYAPTQIGTSEVAAWIKHYEPDESQPSDALIQLTLAGAKVPHRRPGRPRQDSAAPVPAPPLWSRRRLRPLVPGRR
jgi:hypothetical protein